MGIGARDKPRPQRAWQTDVGGVVDHAGDSLQSVDHGNPAADGHVSSTGLEVGYSGCIVAGLGFTSSGVASRRSWTVSRALHAARARSTAGCGSARDAQLRNLAASSAGLAGCAG